MLETLMLSRIQFAANISFHILFPSITIALCWFLLYFKIRYNRSGDEVWMRAYRFWVKVFALTFALGVVSGITMSFQFGTNWPGYMETVGNIAGPLLGYEVLTAGTLFFNMAIQLTDVLLLNLLGNLSLITSVLLGIVWLQERSGFFELAGMLLILLSLVLVQVL